MSFFDKVDLTRPSKISCPINLAKSGDFHKIDLTKNDKDILINLNWSSFSQAIQLDLDLGCMYRFKDGSKNVIQALGKNFGSLTNYPFIQLDKDDRNGSALDGENLFLSHKSLELIDFLVIFAFIYEGVSTWEQTQGIVTIKQQNNADIIINLNNPEAKTMCALATIETKQQQLVITKQERYFSSHMELDQAFGFGFRWVSGSK
ncbi:MAG: hypothetical protein RLZZ293_1437 [Pseudomonadota bacterium]|jgi:tellurite resistance protein TerA